MLSKVLAKFRFSGSSRLCSKFKYDNVGFAVVVVVLVVVVVEVVVDGLGVKLF